MSMTKTSLIIAAIALPIGFGAVALLAPEALAYLQDVAAPVFARVGHWASLIFG